MKENLVKEVLEVSKEDSLGLYDHRRIGKELKIFTFSDDVGQGLPLWLPNGEQLFHTLQEYMRGEEEREGYHYVRTPHISKGKLFERTGHLPYYKENMYAPIQIDNENYYLKPMNCPHHHAVFSELVQSYKQLPYRIAEAGNVYRFESSGNLYGLVRTRGFSQNDAHIYLRQNQLEEEIIQILKMSLRIYEKMGLNDIWFRLSLPDFQNHPQKYSGNMEEWENASQALRSACNRIGKEFIEVKDEAAFYGPKIDIQSRNTRGREETIATIQVDIMIPKRLGLSFTDENDLQEAPVVIHRAILGSYERFIAFLLEKTKGKLPFWLAPIQVSILPVSEKFNNYAESIHTKLKSNSIRSEINKSNNTLSYRIRNVQFEKIPYMIIIGEKEEESNTISVRSPDGVQINSINLDTFIQKIEK